MEKERIEEGAKVLGKVVVSGRIVEGTLTYENGFNPVITDKDGTRWLVIRQSVMRAV